MIKGQIEETVRKAITQLYGFEADSLVIQIQETNKDFSGDFTLVTFPLSRLLKSKPDVIAQNVGEYLVQVSPIITNYNVVKGFLNMEVKTSYWLDFLNKNLNNSRYGFKTSSGENPVVIEYSSPNTNKPLHLGHVRNNLLGDSIARILEANGIKVIKVNLVNDRGIHICKTMLAYKLWAGSKTPESVGIKGDKFVGELYVRFDLENRNEAAKTIEEGMPADEANNQTRLMKDARKMLQQWEEGDEEIRKLWIKMNNWVYDGFEITYNLLGISFDKTYYESETYLLGKELVTEGLKNGVLFRKEDGSVWADLTAEGLDQKLLLRADGTSVYMTQDLGTAQLRYNDFRPEKLLYVVGNEQNYHFDVLRIVMKKLGRDWADNIFHISYGMVELPEGKMKSREGTVVDADELINEMSARAKDITKDLGKINEFTEEQAHELFFTIGMGALKYFILKVDPKKNMLFNPEESVQFDGNTGPFIQYTYARIQSLLRKSKENGIDIQEVDLSLIPDGKEKLIIKLISAYPEVVGNAASEYSPALVANYIYELVKEYNGFYQTTRILGEQNGQLVNFRLALSKFTGVIIRSGMCLLGIEVPEKM